LAHRRKRRPKTQLPADSGNPSSTRRIDVVNRTTRAVSYIHDSGATRKDRFDTYRIGPGQSREQAWGTKSNFPDRPTSFGNEYLTYVLWAISPECRQVNIGEVLVGTTIGANWT
jgi:hypothetical protein